MKLFLDDIRSPLDCFYHVKDNQALSFYKQNDWQIARNYQQFVDAIESHYKYFKRLPEVISFDHDLADEHYAPESAWDNYKDWEASQNFKEKTGYECAKWLVEFCQTKNLKLNLYFCHSMNPHGKLNILSMLSNFEKHS